MKQIIDWFVGITNKLGSKIGISGFATRIAIGGIALFLIVMIIALAVRRKKNKKKKSAVATPVQETAPAVETPVVEEPVVVEPAPVVEEKVAIEEPKKVEKKVAPKKAQPEKTEEPKKEAKKMLGKWVIEHKSKDEFVAVLLASNGEIMLTSETYTTANGAKGGIATIIKGIEADAFSIYQDKKGNYYYKLKNANNRLLCVGEIYTTKDQCQKAVESVKRIASDSPIATEIEEGLKYFEYTPVDAKAYEGKTGGKWKVEVNGDGKFVSKLYASNGQLMLATEEVASKKTALSLIESVKKNAFDGNFIIDKDKFGRFYYKLRNAQKSVICIGESYDKVDSCISALESVRRFALNAKIEII